MGLETRELAIGYDSDIVRDISLKVTPGRIVTLIGPNGSGKSTLLRTVTGLLQKRGGVIFLDGKDKAGMGSADTAKALSMVMTNTVSPELMTCREVVESGRYPYTGMFGKLTENDRKKVDEAIAFTQTEDIADKLITNISDGQRQRVMLARSIAQDPKVLVLDEPTSYLDIKYRIDILSKIRRLSREKNIAVLMSLHEPGIAMQVSDTIVAMGEGRVLKTGSCREVFTEDFIRKLYGIGNADVGLLGERPWITGKKAGCDDPDFSKGVIFVMGTMSNVGKSVVAAGLCRIFAQDGYSVAPFKSQNMANNSFVTADNLEMGRAQVMQAECANTAPSVCMNPILLKPTGDDGSQVVVNGRVVGNMRAAEYFEYKKSLIPVIKEAYGKLKERCDIVVVEGAGSPAEINLKDDDIVNMGLADMINAPVILVGDIDRGGVFAQFEGTLDLLEEHERKRVKGLVVNKFRGDRKLLMPGLDMLTDITGCPVTGVIPYTSLNLDDEDSLSERFSKKKPSAFDMAVIKFPHISNFTDLNVFIQSDDISVRYVTKPSDMKDPDIIILPGTKNTVEDMKWLKDSSLADEIIRLSGEGTVIIGICGGYQMLGRSVSDPDGVESGGTVTGLSLLNVETVIQGEKTKKTFEGSITLPEGVLAPLSGMSVKGYEIHMGQTLPSEDVKEFTSGGSGYCRENVYGSYVHGLFDQKGVASALIGAVAKKRGKSVDVSAFEDGDAYKNRQYDMLADIIRESLDIDMIYEMMGMSRDKK